MNVRSVLVRAIGLTVALLVAAGPVSAQLPDGPGRTELEKVCSSCHDPANVAAKRQDRDGWQATVDDMVSRGALGTDQEMAAILDYLATHFAAGAEELLNINAATARELESVLELLRKEAAALIAYREKVKGFKTLEDLQNIEGVPFKKIEAKKDRITFGTTTAKPQ